MKAPTFSKARLSAVSLVAMSAVLVVSTPAHALTATSIDGVSQKCMEFVAQKDKFVNEYSKQKNGIATSSSCTFGEWKKINDEQVKELLATIKKAQDALKVTFSLDKDGLKAGISSLAGDSSLTIDKNGISTESKSTNGASSSSSVTKDGVTYNSTAADGSTKSGTISSEGTHTESKDSNGNVTEKLDIDKNGISSVKIGDGLMNGSLLVPKTLLDKLQSVNDKAVKKLTDFQEKLKAATSPEQIQAVTDEINKNINEFAVTYVQANVTKAIDSMTRVLDRLQAVANNLQTQANKIKQCVASGYIETSSSAQSSSLEIGSKEEGCDKLNVAVNSGDMAASLQEKVDQSKSDIKTVKSFLSSSINLVTDLNKNEVKGTIESFGSISLQIDIISNMSANIKNNLANLSASILKPDDSTGSN